MAADDDTALTPHLAAIADSSLPASREIKNQEQEVAAQLLIA
ncbi:hypothetical protein ACFP9V_18115 [Deinococcus radiopugnans]|uniref:Uncharacterized protein n=1 Tax=Deinococcus radiopugnans ATCC 19172 TaxID=585398 RepID=A0ABR6NUH4_9DEIO|nr:hypothetical protein [Deinococcus radiopugnans]MBB6017698.1 hypothetical protein [Deinococcus radiopugnans ATCC 19172]